MRVMMIAGEASGDLHGAGVVRELKRREPNIELYGIGGDMMVREGLQLIYHINELSVMGFWEVLKKLHIIRSVEITVEALLKNRKPDILILIDYPGFNLRIAKKAYRLGIKTYYYIGPQIWAWNPGRINKLKQVIDKIFVILPFETAIYQNAGIDVEFVGHPLLDNWVPTLEKQEFYERYGFDNAKPLVGLFPGSRKQELENIFPELLKAGKILKNELGAQIAIGAALFLESDYIKSFLEKDSSVKILQNATQDLMKNCDVAIITSGTATLETAIYQTPMVIVYKTSWFTYIVGRVLIKIKNIGLVNIIAGKTVVPELIQHRAKAQVIAAETKKFLTNPDLVDATKQALKLIYKNLGTPGAAKRVAESILKAIKN